MINFIVDHKDSLIVGVIASLIAISLQIGVKVAANTITYFLTSRIRLRRLYSFKAKTSIYVVSGSVDRAIAEDVAFLAGPDATAAATIIQSLRVIYEGSNTKHYYATRQYLAIVNENLIAVGGPLHNSCTKQMLENISKEVYFDENDNLIFFGNPYAKSLDSGVDYGLVVRHNNPFSPDKEVIILAGCGSHGVLAASMLFEQSKRFIHIYKDFKKKRGWYGNLVNKDFLMLLKCHMTGNEVSNLTIEDLRVF